jgi:hypothetical protein
MHHRFLGELSDGVAGLGVRSAWTMEYGMVMEWEQLNGACSEILDVQGGVCTLTIIAAFSLIPSLALGYV